MVIIFFFIQSKFARSSFIHSILSSPELKPQLPKDWAIKPNFHHSAEIYSSIPVLTTYLILFIFNSALIKHKLYGVYQGVQLIIIGTI